MPYEVKRLNHLSERRRSMQSKSIAESTDLQTESLLRREKIKLIIDQEKQIRMKLKTAQQSPKKQSQRGQSKQQLVQMQTIENFINSGFKPRTQNLRNNRAFINTLSDSYISNSNTKQNKNTVSPKQRFEINQLTNPKVVSREKIKLYKGDVRIKKPKLKREFIKVQRDTLNLSDYNQDHRFILNKNTIQNLNKDRTIKIGELLRANSELQSQNASPINSKKTLILPRQNNQVFHNMTDQPSILQNQNSKEQLIQNIINNYIQQQRPTTQQILSNSILSDQNNSALISQLQSPLNRSIQIGVKNRDISRLGKKDDQFRNMKEVRLSQINQQRLPLKTV
eukprot:403369414